MKCWLLPIWERIIPIGLDFIGLDACYPFERGPFPLDSTPLLVTFPFDSRRVVALESKLTICHKLFLRGRLNCSESRLDSAHLVDGGLVGSLRGPLDAVDAQGQSQQPFLGIVANKNLPVFLPRSHLSFPHVGLHRPAQYEFWKV